MRRASVIYRESGYFGELAPEWLVYNLGMLSEESWEKRLYIPINAPFERQEIDEFDDTASITVPISAYTVREDKPARVGIHLPTVAAFAKERCRSIGATFDSSLIRRLVMRLADIEEVLQIDVRFHIQNGGFD
ncbi:hypothetical protein [Paenibacillus albus]|uniref:Uncharacterized protein n=1 Tax=Paenibacillus albus TaxID=2495582 RepID=A0A3Q8X9C5_9BACL|nr:hypothetical protein [Paenibacillus albus]AZN43391.1 hypothetical protein EJC50_29630 [Paenibacillus albus]